MQITPNVLMNTLLSNVQTQEQRLYRLQEEVSTGQAFQIPSDNPSAVTNTMALNDTLASVKSYLGSATSAQSILNETNGVLQNVVQLTQSAYALATQAANSTLNGSDITAIQETVKTDLSSLAQLLNTQYQGTYILGGTNNTTPPLDIASSSVTWNPGATGSQNQEFQLGSDQFVTANITGAESGLVATTSSPPSPFNAFLQLYQNLQGLEQTLSSGSAGVNVSAIEASAQSLSGDLGNMTTLQSIVGARMQRVQNAQTQLHSLSLNLNQSIAQYSSADMASVTIQLAQEEQAYQATLQSGAQILPLSLLNFIKP
ncbi:MAG: flagellin N-terminal helical domain-containing protein [Sulfobacillus sp.]